MRIRFAAAALVFLASVSCAFAQYGVHDTIKVNHHVIKMDLCDFEGHQIKGNAELQLESKVKKLSYVPLNLLSMEIDSVFVNGKPVRGEVRYDGQMLRIPLGKKLKAGRKADVRVVYHGVPVERDFGGFSWFSEQRMAHNMGVSINDIPHSYGKAWYPCVDDFRAKSTYDFYYTVPADLIAVGNGLLQSSVSKEGGTTEWHWSMAQRIPDYLTSVAVGPYKKLELDYRSGGKKLPVDIYVTESEYSDAAECYGLIPAALASLERHFGPYPFDRVGFVSVNTKGGAMEHASNISMPRVPKPSSSYQETAIHELIHSWFGNLVTCMTAGDMWLNEGITTYVVEIVLEDFLEQGLIKQEQLDAYKQSLDRVVKMIPKDHPRYHALANMPQTDTYGILVYRKGAWVMRQLRETLGDELFFKAMKDYVEHYSWGNATTEGFKSSVEESTGVNLTDFFNNYIYS